MINEFAQVWTSFTWHDKSFINTFIDCLVENTSHQTWNFYNHLTFPQEKHVSTASLNSSLSSATTLAILSVGKNLLQIQNLLKIHKQMKGGMVHNLKLWSFYSSFIFWNCQSVLRRPSWTWQGTPPPGCTWQGTPPPSAPWHSGKCCKALWDMGTPPQVWTDKQSETITFPSYYVRGR